MSAIFGFFRRDSQPIDPTHAPLMRDALAHRGVDGLSVWHNDHIALGHARLATTPDAAIPLPYHADHLIITADSLLSNRAALCDALSLPYADSLPDAAIIAAAYTRWGDSFPTHLDGAFAIALWDQARHTLLCARDHFGLKPLYYYASSQLFAFATEIKAVLAHPLIPRRLNELRLADFLLLDVSDTRHTFYEGIQRLPAAHTLRVTPSDLHESAYWQLPINPPTAQGSDADLIERFRTLFLNAMQANLRANQRIGSLFSGGMDSSAITVTARRYLPDHQSALPTFTAIAPSIPKLDESMFVNAVLAQGGYEPHVFNAEDVGPYYDQDRMLYHMEEPGMVGTLFMQWGAAALAQQDGVRVLLIGNGGDEVVGHGMGYLAEMAYAQQWDRFDHEATALRSTYFTAIERDPLVSYYKYGFPVITRFARELRPFAAARAITHLSDRTGLSRRRLLKKYVLRPFRRSLRSHDATPLPGLPANPDFARRIDLPDRYHALNQHTSRHPASQWEDQYHAFTLGTIPYTFETIDRLGGAFGMEMRQPFVDRALVEYSLTVPGHLKLRDGYTRWILREALRDLLPEANYKRLSKSELSGAVHHSMLTYEAEWLAQALRRTDSPLARYLDLPRARTLIDHMLAHPTSGGIGSVARLLSLERWLSYTNL